MQFCTMYLLVHYLSHYINVITLKYNMWLCVVAKRWHNQKNKSFLLKFIYFEKATKIWRNLQVQKKLGDFVIPFVAFSEYMNLLICIWLLRQIFGFKRLFVFSLVLQMSTKTKEKLLFLMFAWVLQKSIQISKKLHFYKVPNWNQVCRSF